MPVHLAEYKLGKDVFGRTDDGSEDMAIDGTTGTSEVIWNGTGAADTGGDWTRGGASGQSETTGSAKSGTNGLDTDVRALDDQTTFSTTSFDPGTKNSLEFWINLRAAARGYGIQLAWKLSSGLKGNRLNLADYVTLTMRNWFHVSIPMEDFGLSTNVDELVIAYVTKAGTHVYLDDIEFTTTGGPFTFRAAPLDATERWRVGNIALVIADGDTGWDSSSFGAIAGPLTNGVVIRHRRISTAEVLWSIPLKDNLTLFGEMIPSFDFQFGNSELLITFALKPEPATVIVTDDDVLEVVISDDLSDLVALRGYVHFGIEEVG